MVIQLTSKQSLEVHLQRKAGLLARGTCLVDLPEVNLIEEATKAVLSSLDVILNSAKVCMHSHSKRGRTGDIAAKVSFELVVSDLRQGFSSELSLAKLKLSSLQIV